MPFMEDIQQVLNQNVNLAVLEGWEALFVERLSRRGSVANRAKVAGRMPVHLSSAGLVLMAHQPQAVQAAYLRQFADPAGRVSAAELRSMLAGTAGQGYAELAGVVDPDTWGIAVPVRDAQDADRRGAGRGGSTAGDAAAGTGAGPADRGTRHRPPPGRLPHRSTLPFNGRRVTHVTAPGAH